MSAAAFDRYVAMGDSQTEGVGDPYPEGGECGWADRFAAHLAAVNPCLLYANLAVRGRRIAEIREQQLSAALALEPDLVSLIAGLNDVIRVRFALSAALSHMEAMQRQLHSSGATVVTVTFPDLSSFVPAARPIRARLKRYNAGLRSVAERTTATLLDLERVPLTIDPRLWCDDRLHLNPEGHRAFAATAAAFLERPGDHESWPPLPPPLATSPASRIRAELRWARAFALPWIGRRLTGRSSGDGRQAKLPELLPAQAMPLRDRR